MSVVLEPAATTRRVNRATLLVSEPRMKFVVGMVAALSAVFFPRLMAALTAADQPRVTFVSREYFLLAFSFSALVAVVVMILEWRVPRAPRDTFMTTLGIPAMLAGALSASQGTTALQQAIETQEKLAAELGKLGGIAMQPSSPPAARNAARLQGSLLDAVVTHAYASSFERDSPSPQSPPRLGIFVEEPLYLIVFGRTPKREEAEARMADLTARRAKVATPRPVALQIQRHANEFLIVVSGGPRPKNDALLEALRLKDVYHVAPVLVEVPPTRK